LDTAWTATDKLYRQFTYVQLLGIVLTALLKASWHKEYGDSLLSPNLLTTWFLFAVLFVCSLIDLTRGGKVKKSVFLGIELAVTLLCALYAGPRLFAVLYVLIIAKAALLFPLAAVVFMIVLTLTVHWSLIEWRRMHANRQAIAGIEQPHPRLALLEAEGQVLALVVLCFGAGLARALAAEQKSRAEAERLAAEVHDLAVRLERTRIARDIHDSLGHTLTSLNIQLDVARKLQERDPEKARESLIAAKALASQSLSDVRAVVHSIRDAEFDFTQALDTLIAKSRQSGAFNIELECEVSAVPSPLAHHFFCIVQECLTNVQRHAHATAVAIKLKQQASHLLLEINDNGCGFSYGDKSAGFGIKGMRERAESMGGTLAVETEKAQGTTVSVCVPLRAG
jgi:signal transduction histidine kinase